MIQETFLELSRLGVGDFKHINGSLEAHLMNTYNLLKAWHSDENVYLAGLYHAMYGTAGFEAQVCDLAQREQIRALVGEPVERLIYLYCACDRQQFYPKIGTTKQLDFVDRFTQTEYAISLSTLKALCTIIMANELEIANHDNEISKAFISQWGDALKELFNRMETLVSDSAFIAYKNILG